MNFEFDSEQMMLRDQAERFLREQCPSSRVREVAEQGLNHCARLWQQTSEMGWHGIGIPEAYGGFGGGYLELCMLAEQIGSFLAPLPFASTQYLASRSLLLAGDEAQKRNYLESVASGERIGCMAVVERPGAFTQRPQAYVQSGRLFGEKSPVMDGLAADFAIVSARIARENDAPVALYVVNLTEQGVQRTALPVIDPSRPFARLKFHNVSVQALGGDGKGPRTLEKILDGAATLIAFEQLGGAGACLKMASQFALERKAFGRAIGSFQATKHKLADMYIKQELARANAYFAAWALQSDNPELALAAPAARISATDAFEFAAQENIQIHGGMGYTYEVDAHLYYRRSRMLAQVIGSSREWKERLAARLIHQRSEQRLSTQAGAARVSDEGERHGFQ